MPVATRDPTITGRRFAELCNGLVLDAEHAAMLLHSLGLLKEVPQDVTASGVTDRLYYISDSIVLAARLCQPVAAPACELPTQLATVPGIKGNGFALIRYLWPGRTATIQDVADDVWGDDQASKEAIRKAVDRANRKLAELGQAFRLVHRGEHVALLQQP